LETPITLEDFVDCGKVYEQLRKNPNLEVNQVARVTRLSATRVRDIVEYLQCENLIARRRVKENTFVADVGRERIVEIFGPPQNSSSVPITAKMTDEASLPSEAQKNEVKKNEETKVCFSCQNPLPQTYYDEHDGLCPSCYYKALLTEAAKQERRSGIYGSDRAGTW